MSNELLTMLEYLERERGISRETLLQAMQEAIIKAAGKGFGGYTRELRVEISPKTGKICGVANVLVVDTTSDTTYYLDGLETEGIALASLRPMAKFTLRRITTTMSL